MKIAILGIDGVGKSTIINSVKNSFNKDVEHFHFMPIEHTHKNSNYVNFSNIKTYNMFISQIKLFYLILKFLFLWIINVFQRNKKVFIFDRVIFDAVVHPSRYLLNRNILGLRLLFIFRHFFDHVIVLHCDENIIYSRCKENSIYDIKKIQENYIYYSKKYNFFLLDTNDNISNIENEVLNKINNK